MTTTNHNNNNNNHAVRDPLSDFRSDSIYQAFLVEPFHLPSTLTLLGHLPISEQLSKLAAGIETIKHNIHRLTSANCEELFQRCTRLDHLHQDLANIQQCATSLSKSLELIRSRLELPYQELLRQVALISRFQRTCDLLRKMLRVIYLARRLAECNLKAAAEAEAEKEAPKAGSLLLKEAIKVSQYINEIDLLMAGEEVALAQLKPIAVYLEQIGQRKREVNEVTDRLVKLGLTAEADVNVLGTALQVYHNLSMLDEKLETLLTMKAEAITAELNRFYSSLSLNEHRPRTTLTTAAQTTTKTTAQVRTALRSMLETVFLHFGHVTLLMKVLRRRRDNFTQTPLIEFLPADGRNKVGDFWAQVVRIMADRLVQFANGSFSFKQTFESDYAAILAIFLDFYQRVVTAEPEVANERFFRSVVQHFESAYLSNSLSRLFKVVNGAFSGADRESGQGVPSERHVDQVIEAIEVELNAATFNRTLLLAVARNVQKTINVFNVKCEHIVAVDGHATQVIGPCTESQRHNAFIVHICGYFDRKLRALLLAKSEADKQQYPQEVVEMLVAALNGTDTLVGNIFQPLVASVLEAIEAILLTMHNENFNIQGTRTPRESQHCSLYMRELHGFLGRIRQTYLALYPAHPAIKARIHQLSSRTIDLFLLHVSILTPVSAAGRAKLMKDIDQLEVDVEPICERLGEAGRSYQTLRAFRVLLTPTLAFDELATKVEQVVDNPVPYWLVLHFLISNFGGAEEGVAEGEEIISPRKYKEMSITFYLMWFEKSDHNDRLDLFKQVLDVYVEKVRRSGGKTFNRVYPILIGLVRRKLEEARFPKTSAAAAEDTNRT